VSVKDGRRIQLSLPHLDGATAATLLDLCGQLQVVLWRVYGDEIEAYWTATDPEQPICAPSPGRRR
jgi:hypothetical protein